VTVKAVGSTSDLTLEIKSNPDQGDVLIAKSFEEVFAETAGSAGQPNTLDYSSQSADITIDVPLGTATGLSRVTGFNALITGSLC